MITDRFYFLWIALCLSHAYGDMTDKKKHHHHHHHKDEPAKNPSKEPAKEEQILGKMKKLETELAKKEEAVKGVVTKGRIEVNGPLPADFAQKFSAGTATATGADPSEVKVVETNPMSGAALLQT